MGHLLKVNNLFKKAMMMHIFCKTWLVFISCSSHLLPKTFSALKEWMVELQYLSLVPIMKHTQMIWKAIAVEIKYASITAKAGLLLDVILEQLSPIIRVGGMLDKAVQGRKRREVPALQWLLLRRHQKSRGGGGALYCHYCCRLLLRFRQTKRRHLQTATAVASIPRSTSKAIVSCLLLVLKTIAFICLFVSWLFNDFF